MCSFVSSTISSTNAIDITKVKYCAGKKLFSMQEKLLQRTPSTNAFKYASLLLSYAIHNIFT